METNRSKPDDQDKIFKFTHESLKPYNDDDDEHDFNEDVIVEA